MSTSQMLLIHAVRIEFHPDFFAELVAEWRTRWWKLADRNEVCLLASHDFRELEPADAIAAAQQQLLHEVIASVTDRFWAEYRAAASSAVAKNQKDADDKSTPPASSDPSQLEI